MITNDIRYEESCKNIKKKAKKSYNLKIPKTNEYIFFKNANYTIIELKKISKYYNLKCNGNKLEIHNRIYNHLYNSVCIIIIQKHIRSFFVKRYIKLIGPAIINRILCSNSSDFFTFENLNTIKFNQFFCYKTIDNTIWGFNILSFYNLFLKTDGIVLNPYTREKIDLKHFKNVKQIIILAKILNVSTEVVLNNNDNKNNIKKNIELKTLDIFQYIDSLGNYTNHDWFLSLNKRQLLKFLHELIDIWEYRSQLEINIKKQICNPYGNPFKNLNLSQIHSLNFYQIQEILLSIIEEFTKKGINKDSCNLGASYILCGLTLVNTDAALAMPWLYQSVSTIN
tara:strand:+ start:112 stop:1128 length:1017 start_codon:yes stop_codon:yes gene_type:complete